MGVNKTLSFTPRTSDHTDECGICGRTRLGKKAVCAVFTPKDPPVYAHPYCHTCIRGLALAAGFLEKVDIVVVSAPGDRCGGTKILKGAGEDKQPCPGCRACS